MSVSALPNCAYPLAQKLVWMSKRNFTCNCGALRLRAGSILVENGPKIKGGGRFKK